MCTVAAHLAVKSTKGWCERSGAAVHSCTAPHHAVPSPEESAARSSHSTEGRARGHSRTRLIPRAGRGRREVRNLGVGDRGDDSPSPSAPPPMRISATVHCKARPRRGTGSRLALPCPSGKPARGALPGTDSHRISQALPLPPGGGGGGARSAGGVGVTKEWV
jgi:hypothetical protein